MATEPKKPTNHKATRSGSRSASAANKAVQQKKAAQKKTVDISFNTPQGVTKPAEKGIPDFVKLILCVVVLGGLLFGYTGASLEQWVHDSQAEVQSTEAKPDEVKTDAKR
jgi:hypothetical protein